MRVPTGETSTEAAVRPHTVGRTPLGRRRWFPLITGLLAGLLVVGLLALTGNEYGMDGGTTATGAPPTALPGQPRPSGKGDEGPGGERGAEGGGAGRPGGALGTAAGGETGQLGAAYDWLNTGLIVGSLGTGVVLLFGRARRFLGRRGRLLRRVFGGTLFGLFVLDVFITGPGGLQSLVEQLNLGLLGVLAATAFLLYYRPRRLWPGWYWPLRNVHVAFAMVYAVKFVAEPLLAANSADAGGLD